MAVQGDIEFRPDVLLPVRNPREAWLREAIDSVCMQSDDISSLVVVLHPGDRSLEPLLRSLPIRTQVIVTPDQCSLPEALNLGLDACQASLVARMDQDDICLPSRFRRQAQYLQRNPRVAVIASHYRIVDDRSLTIGNCESPQDRKSLVSEMRWKCAIAHSTTTFRRDVIRQVGGYRSQACGAEDYDLWLRVLQEFEIDVVPAPLLSYRTHDGQMSQRNALTRAAIAAISESRLGLAAARRESQTAARIRQLLWTARQLPRQISRG